MNSMNPELRVVCKLGEGSFAEVFKVANKRTNETYAVKRLKKRYRTTEEVNRLPEINTLRLLQGHPNIVKLHDVIFDQHNGYVAMMFELMDCNLYELISQHKRPYDEDTSLILIYQLLKSVEFMHSKNLFHRDIKPENCMVDRKTFVLKLVDFGSTRCETMQTPYTEYVSTRWYRAPECILTSGSYGKEVDEWAIGCMMYELLTTRPLFPGKHEIDQIARIHNVVGTPGRDILAQFQQNPNRQINFHFPPRQAQDFHKLLPSAKPATLDIMRKLLIYDPHLRISAKEALEHPAFEKFRIAEVQWAGTDQSIPFPLFALNVMQSQAIPPQMQAQTQPTHNPYQPVQYNPINYKPKPKPNANQNNPLIANVPVAPKKPVVPAPNPAFGYTSAASYSKYVRELNAARFKQFQQKKAAAKGSLNHNPVVYGYAKPHPSLIQPHLTINKYY